MEVYLMPVTHSTLPGIIRSYYPDIGERLNQSCWEQYYHYKSPGHGIVGGFDGRFYVVDPVTKTNKYLEEYK
jgi:hypothetical protein